MKKILVTGGTGLIGTQTLPLLLEKGFDVYVLTTTDRQDCDGVTFIKANLFDTVSMRNACEQVKAHYLLHYAWTSTGQFHDNSNYDFLTASIELLKAFHQNGGKRVVMAGTYAEYGYCNETLVESMPVEPINIYSACKNFTRQVAEHYCKNNDISFGWGRIFSAYGKETDPRRLTSYVVNQLNANKEVVIRSGSLVRDYIYVKDVAAAFVQFLDSDVEGAVNICTGIERTIKDYVLTIANLLGKTELITFDEQASPQQTRVVGDSTRLNTEVGFVPTYDLKMGLGEILS